MTSTGPEGRESWLCATFIPPLYSRVGSRRIRTWLRRLTLRLEGGAMYSLTTRRLYRRFHDVDVGLYTIGPCEAGPENFARGTSIGRYSSIYYTVRTEAPEIPEFVWQEGEMRRRDTADRPSGSHRLLIGNDVFIGHNAVILPTTREIGDGAFIGAGAVVQNPVPPYAVVMGNPARVVKYRFSRETIADLVESRWWQKSLEQLTPDWNTFVAPLEGLDSGVTPRP